jgi:hypothetical protein
MSLNELGSTYVKIGADLAPFQKGLASVKNSIMGLATKRFNLPGGGLLGMLGVAGLGVGFGAAIKSVIGGASDLSESLNKVGAVFGPAAETIINQADEMAKKFGLNKVVMLDAAAGIGLVGKAAGQTEAEAAALGNHMSKLAADASSFYNIPMEEALLKIKSGLVGEAEPMRALGVLLDEESVKNYAYAAGLAVAGSKLDQQTKVMARAALITSGLADATGDLERTSGGFANQSRQLAGALQNIAAQIGESLLPAFTEFVNLMNQVALDFSTNFDGMKDKLGGFVDFVRGGIGALGVIYRNWGLMLERTGRVAVGWYTNLGEAVMWLGGVVGSFLDWFSSNWKAIFVDAFEVVSTLLINLGQNFGNFAQAIIDFFESGGTKPFDMKFVPMLEGMAPMQTPPLKVPKLELSSPDFTDIDEKINDNEAKNEEEYRKKKAAGKGKDAPLLGGAGKTKDTKAEFVGLEEFSKKIQVGALDKDDAGKKTANATAKAAGHLESIDKKIKNAPAAAVAVGPA